MDPSSESGIVFPGELLETTTTTLSTGMLYVNVDFNDLLDRHPEEAVFELLGKLKDLLA